MKNKDHSKLSKKIESFDTFSEILSYRANVSPEKIFLIEGDKVLTYKKFNNLVDSCCFYFKKNGIIPGNVISVVLRNSVDYLIIYFAAIRSRLIINPFPYHTSANEVIQKARDVKPEIIFCHNNHFKSLLKSKYKIINLDKIGDESFSIYLEGFKNKSHPILPIIDNQVAVYYYSSGTTGGPKIIEYTHKSMVLGQASMVRAGFSKLNSVHLCVLPLGHTASLRYTVKQCICTGSMIVLYESFWKLRSNLWSEVDKHKATFMEIVPSILIAILNTPYKDFNKKQVNSISFIGCGSAFLPKNLQDSFEKKFGIKVANLYGLSETGATHFDDPSQDSWKAGSIGKPFDIVECKIFTESGKEVKDGNDGEIGIKGPGLFKGYLNNTKLYNNCFHKGFFMTGDIGRKDKQGNYYYTDRKKDLIIKGGINIVPSHIEGVLQSYPFIKEAAVIGVPDMLLGETIKCFLIPKNGIKIDADKIRNYCKEKLGDFKTPSEIEIVETLPKGPSGKILKKDLRLFSTKV
jgi:long-chain acyl-CoA synthetase